MRVVLLGAALIRQSCLGWLIIGSDFSINTQLSRTDEYFFLKKRPHKLCHFGGLPYGYYSTTVKTSSSRNFELKGLFTSHMLNDRLAFF